MKRQFHCKYAIGDSIGTGTFATVNHCRRISDGKRFAVKVVDKHQLTNKELIGLRCEIRILQSFKFPHIINMHDVYDDGTKVKIVLELCEGGDLFDLLIAAPNQRFDEDQCAQIICIIARALKCMHSNFVVHRDLKPENILFTANGTLKITDFGLAHYMKLPPQEHVMHTCCGTPSFISPDILTGDEYSYKIDYWSLGVIAYMMLSGTLPFRSESLHEMYGMIVEGKYSFPEPTWTHVSESAKDLVRSLMCVDPDKRYGADQIMKHEYITEHVDLELLKRNELRVMSFQKKQAIVSVNQCVDKTDDAPVSGNNGRSRLISYKKILWVTLLFFASAMNSRKLLVSCVRFKMVILKLCQALLMYFRFRTSKSLAH